MNEYWVKQERASLTKLSSFQELTVIVGSPPQPNESLGQCISNTNSIGAGCTAKAQSRQGPRILQKQMSGSIGAMYIDLHQVFCFQNLCPPIISNTPVFFDGNHISYEIAVKLIPYFAEELNANATFRNLNVSS